MSSGPLSERDVLRRSMLDEEIRERVEHIAAVQTPFDADGQARPAELVDDSEHAELLSDLSAVVDKVTSPDVMVATPVSALCMSHR
jgi:hypothetical protein